MTHKLYPRTMRDAMYPRTLQEAFGPYASNEVVTPRESLSPAEFVAIPLLVAIASTLLITVLA